MSFFTLQTMSLLLFLIVLILVLVYIFAYLGYTLRDYGTIPTRDNTETSRSMV